MITCQVNECQSGGQRLRRATLQHVQRDVRRKDAVGTAGRGIRLCGLRLPAVQAPLQQLHRFRGCSASTTAALKRMSPGLGIQESAVRMSMHIKWEYTPFDTSMLLRFPTNTPFAVS